MLSADYFNLRQSKLCRLGKSIGTGRAYALANNSNSLPNDKILAWSKLKAFADDKLHVVKIIIFLFDRLENTVRKGENAGYQHFSPFPTMFLKLFFPGVVKSRDYVVKSLTNSMRSNEIILYVVSLVYLQIELNHDGICKSDTRVEDSVRMPREHI